MPRTDRIPGTPTRLRRAFSGIGSDFVPYVGAIKGVDLGARGLTTTGLGTFGNLDVDTLNLDANVISDSTGTISFDNENLTTSGTVDADGLVIGTTGGGTITEIYNEDDMATDSQTGLATQQSIKAYVDATVLTQEEVEDFAGEMVANATGTHTGIAISYQDATGDMDFVVDHDTATNYVADQHVAHTGVTLTAGIGISGGGDISASRTFDLDILGLTTDTIAAGDWVPFHDLTDAPNKITFANFEGTLDHGNLAGIGDDDHTDYHTDGRAATWLAANHETTYTHTDIALNTTHRGSVGTDHGYIDQDVQISANPTFAGAILADEQDGSDVSLTLRNTAADDSLDETLSLIATHTSSNFAGGKIVFGRDGDYTSPTEKAGFIEFYTAEVGADTLALKIDYLQNFNFQTGSLTTTGSGTFGGCIINGVDVFNTSSTDIKQVGSSSSYAMLAGSDDTNGAYFVMYGDEHASLPGDHYWWIGGTQEPNSLFKWFYRTTAGSTELMRLTKDANLTLYSGTATFPGAVINGVDVFNTNSTDISQVGSSSSFAMLAGSDNTNGAYFVMYGDEHGAAPGDFYWFSGGTQNPASDFKWFYRNSGGNTLIMSLTSTGTLDVQDDIIVGSSTTASNSVFSGTSFPVLLARRYSASTTGILGGVSLDRETTGAGDPADGYGVGFYFRLENASNALNRFAGLIGGRWGDVSPNEIGEIVIVPAYGNNDPYNDVPTLAVRATAAGGSQTITIDSTNKLTASSSTFNFDNDHITTTGTVTAALFSAGGTNGVDGSFTAGSGETITVTKGLITGIV